MITPHRNYTFNCACSYMTHITATYNSSTLHNKYNYNCIKPHYIQQLWWGDHCKHCYYFEKPQL